MARDYREHLDEAALGLLAETTGFATSEDAPQFFRSRPHDICLALGSPAAVRLLDPGEDHGTGEQYRLLQLAIAVHRTAEEICYTGWTAAESSYVDLSLLRFSGQTEYQRFIVGLLASFLSSPPPIEIEPAEIGAPQSSAERLLALVDLCSTVAETERAGALRLLGDEALFCAGVFPDLAHLHAVDEQFIEALHSVIPRAVMGLLDDLEPELTNLLDVHLLFGPIWYRMAAQNLLHSAARADLNNISTDFATARRFLVRIVQGPLAHLRLGLYPDIA